MTDLRKMITALAILLGLTVGFSRQASAMTGTGSQADPYVVTTYDELGAVLNRENAEAEAEIFIRLGNDIIQEDTQSEYYLSCKGSESGRQTMHLDLAGKTLSRKSTTYNGEMFRIEEACHLIMDDSVGGGSVKADFKSGEMVCIYKLYDTSASLTVNAGIYTAENGGSTSTAVAISTFNADTIILNGGTFSAAGAVIHHTKGHMIINGGTFIQTKKETAENAVRGIYSADTCNIYNCTIKCTADDGTTSLYTTNSNLGMLIPSTATVKVDDVDQTAAAQTTRSFRGKEIVIQDSGNYDLAFTVTEPSQGATPSSDITISNDRVVKDDVLWNAGNSLMSSGAVFDFFSSVDSYKVCIFVSNDTDKRLFFDKVNVTVNGKPAKLERINGDSQAFYSYVFNCSSYRKTGDCFWSYDSSTKTLTITGNGSMEDYASPVNAPWFNKRADIENLVIEDGVTSIGDRAFADLEIESLVLPDSVKTIGKEAFLMCEGLESVSLGKGVTTIGEAAFCTSYTGHNKLTGVAIPTGVTDMGAHAVGYTISYLDGSYEKVEGFTVTGNCGSVAEKYAGENGLIWKSTAHTLTKVSAKAATIDAEGNKEYYTCPCGKWFEDAAATKEITDHASVMIPKKDPSEEIMEYKKGDVVKDEASGGSYKIISTTNLTVVYNSVINTSASEVKIPAKVTIGGKTYKVTEIAAKAFKNNKKLKKITIGSSITKIGKEAFFGCKNLKTVKIQTTKLKTKNVGKNAFKKLNAKAKFSVPKKKLKSYRKLLQARGATGRKQKITK